MLDSIFDYFAILWLYCCLYLQPTHVNGPEDVYLLKVLPRTFVIRFYRGMRWRTFRGFVLNENIKKMLMIKAVLVWIVFFTQSGGTHSLLVVWVGEKLVPVPEVRVLFVPADVPPVANESLGRELSTDLLCTCSRCEVWKVKTTLFCTQGLSEI